MKAFAFSLVASVLCVGFSAFAAESTIFLPQDGKTFSITQNDVVRIITPGSSTGYKTEVKIEGEAKDMISHTLNVKDGNTVPGSDHTQVDVVPNKGKTGVVKVWVTTTPPGGAKGETKEYVFEVK